MLVCFAQLTFVSVASSYRIVAAAGACAALLPLLLPSPATRHPISVAERADRRRKRSQSKAGGGSGGAGVGEEKEKLWLLETTAAFGIFCFYVGLEAGYVSCHTPQSPSRYDFYLNQLVITGSLAGDVPRGAGGHG